MTDDKRYELEQELAEIKEYLSLTNDRLVEYKMSRVKLEAKAEKIRRKLADDE